MEKKVLYVIIFLLTFSSLAVSGQIKTYEIYKIDSTNHRIFIYSDKNTCEDINLMTNIIRNIELQFNSFVDLNISFFDGKMNTGYQIESVEITNDSLVDIKVNDVQNHWIAEYLKSERKYIIFKPDGTLKPLHTYFIKDNQ